MKIHKTSIPIDQFYEPFFCFLPDVNFPTSGSTPAQIPMWGLLLGLSVKSLHVGSQGQTRRDEGSRPLRGGSVIGRAQFVSPIHACFSFGACTIQSRRFWLSSSHFAISNIFVLACILSMRRLVSSRSQMLSSVSKPVAFIGSSSSGNTCATVPPSPAARIASSLRSRKEQNTTTGCSAIIMTTKPLTKSTSCCGSRSCGLYKIRPQRKGRQTCRFFLCDLKIMNLLQNQRGRCIDSGSQLLIEHIQTLGVSAE